MNGSQINFKALISADHSPRNLRSQLDSGVCCDHQLANELWQFYLVGLKHADSAVRHQFSDSVRAARRAARENADELMISAALLCFPCHMLSSGLYIREPWNSDWLLESGTYDWLGELFGEMVAEVIRLQPHCRRYLGSINRRFCASFDRQQQEQFLREGGEMSLESKFAFAKLRYFSQAMQLSRWILRMDKTANDKAEITVYSTSNSALPCLASSVN